VYFTPTTSPFQESVMTLNSRLAVLSLAAAIAIAPAAYTCIHPPRDFKGSIEQTAQSAVILWHAGRQELVLRNDYQITPADDGQLPAAIAWVIPVPSVPDTYAIASRELFAELFTAFESLMIDTDSPNDSRGGIKRAQSNGIKLLPAESVGEYTIQPIKTIGEDGAVALNAWLRDNGFAEVPAAAMAYYVKRDWVWLAVKADLANGGGEIVRRGGLRPLRISFASKELIYPLLFSQHQGIFDVVLWVLTEQPLNGLHNSLAPYGFHFDGKVHLDSPPATLSALQDQAQRDGHWTAIVKPWLHKATGLRVNSPANPLASWQSDFQIDITAALAAPADDSQPTPPRRYR
jgi:hypothetical protein